MEVAALGLKVETQGVDGANKALDKLVALADRAEKAISGLEAAADSAGKKTRELDKGASGAADSTRALDKGASGAATSTKELDKGASEAAKSTSALDKGATGAAKATDALDKGAGKADKSTKGMGESASKATAQVDEMGKKAASTERGVSSFASAALKAGAVLAAAFSVSSIARYADAWSDMQSKVGAATKDMDGAASMMTRLVDIANASYSPLEQTVTTYSRNVTVLRDLGKSSSQAADYVESLNNMLVLTATRGERAASVQDALSKALATGKLEADGLETVLANGGEVASALARQLNTTTSGLRGLASQGKITGSVIADSMIKSLDDVRKRAAEMPSTISDAFTILTNNVTELVGKIDKATGASSAISGGIITFAGWLRTAGDYAIALGAVAKPAFDLIGSSLSVIADNSTVVGVALAGFAAPVVLGGITSLATAIGVGLVGAVKALAAVMLANPLGLFVAALATAGYAAYKFRDDIKQAVGVDVVATAKGAANTLIGSFAAAYEDIKFTWANFGDILGGAVIGGVNLAIRAINRLIQGSISGVNSLVEAINNIPGVDIGKIGSSVGINEMDNPYAARLGASIAQRNAAVQAAMSRDYVGDIGGWLNGIGKGGTGSGAGGNGSGGTGAGAGGKSAKAVAIEAETDAIKRALKDQIMAFENANDQNEYLYSLGIRQAQEYYSAKGALGRDSALAEAAAAEQEIGVINKALAANKLTEDQRKKLLEDRRKLVGDVSAATVKAFVAEINAEEAAARKRISLQQDMTKSAQSAAGAAADQANALALQVEQYGMTATAIAKANVVRAEEELALAQTTRAMAVMRGERAEDIALMDQEIESIKQRTIALRSVASSTARLEILDKDKEFVAEAKKQNEQIGESLTDALLRGFEDGKGFAKNFKDTMVNMFKTMVLKPIIQPIAQGAANTVTSALGLGGAGQTGTGGGLFDAGSKLVTTFLGGSPGGYSSYNAVADNVAGLSSGANAMYGAVTDWAWNSIGSSNQMVSDLASTVMHNSEAIAGFANAASNVLAYGGAVMAALNGQFGTAIGTAIGAYFGGPIGAFIGSKIGGLIDGMLGGERRAGGTYAMDEDGNIQFMHGPSGGQAGAGAGVKSAMAATVGTINETLLALGSSLTVTAFRGAFEQSEKGRGGVMSGGMLSDGSTFGESGLGSNYAGTYYEKSSSQSPSVEEALAAFTTDLKQVTVQALQAATDIPEAVKALVRGVDTEGMSDEAITELLTTINDQILGVQKFRNAMMTLPFENLRDLSYDAAQSLISLSGGMEQLSTNMTDYLEKFYSDSERAAITMGQLGLQLALLGVEMPRTREGYRSIIEAQDATTASGQLVVAAMLEMAGQFDGLVTYLDAQDAALRELNAAFAGFMFTLPSLAALTGKTRDSMVEFAGGISALQSSVSSYYQAYHTEAERNADTLRSVTGVFSDLGLAVPRTREDFRALVEGLDLTTESGQKTFVALMGVRASFEVVADNLTAVITAARESAKTLASDAMTNLTRAVNTQKDALAKAWESQRGAMQEGIDAASTALAEHQALSQRVKATLQSLFGQIGFAMQRSVAQSQISDALASARAGGPLPTAASLESAFGVIAQPSQELFKTFSDYQLDFLKTANDIAALGQLTDAQISVEERTLNAIKQQLVDAEKAYKAEIDYYDSILTTAQAQLDAALGNTQATLTVAQAMTALTSSIAGLVASQSNKPPSSNGAPAGLSASEQAVWDAYNSSGIGYLDAGGWQFWNDAIQNGANPSDIAQQIIDINNGKNQINGSHANGLDYVPFNGYMAKLHEGERVKTKAEARAEDMARVRQSSANGMMADAESLRILQQLLIRVGDMSAETKAIAQNTGQWMRLANRWDGDGVPPTRDELI